MSSIIQKESLQDRIDGALVELGILEYSSEKSEVITEPRNYNYTYYFTKKFTITANELLDTKEYLPKVVMNFINGIKTSVVYESIVKENTALKEENSRLKEFETYYNLHYKMINGKKNDKTILY